jgi:hypothetical protein
VNGFSITLEEIMIKNMLTKVFAGFIMMISFSIVHAQDATDDDTIKTEATTNSTVTTKSDTKTKLESPPPSAISPTINTSNSDLCTFGVAGAIQTQILGISTGTQVVDENCERLKLAKTIYDMGMKVAAVSVMCQDQRVFDAMMDAGTPCPYDGLIGKDAKNAWEVDPDRQPGAKDKEEGLDNGTKTLLGGAGVASLLILLLL